MSPQHSVLVVDDDAGIRRLLEKTLERAGYEVFVATDGAEGLKLLQAHPSIALILLDLMMPGMDGWRFRHAQARNPKIAAIPTIIVTGSEVGAALRHELQAVDYISKPFTAERLLTATADAIRIASPASAER